MTMDRRHGAWLPFHNLKMHQNFAGAILCADELVAIEINQAHIVWLHKTLGDQRGRTQRNVLSRPNGNVAPVAIHISALPQTAANLADLQLQSMNLRRVEERLNFAF